MASPWRIVFRPAHVNWSSSALSVKNGAAVYWWIRRKSASAMTPATASTSQVSQASCRRPAIGGAATRSAGAAEGVAAIAVRDSLSHPLFGEAEAAGQPAELAVAPVQAMQ